MVEALEQIMTWEEMKEIDGFPRCPRRAHTAPPQIRQDGLEHGRYVRRITLEDDGTGGRRSILCLCTAPAVDSGGDITGRFLVIRMGMIAAWGKQQRKGLQGMLG